MLASPSPVWHAGLNLRFSRREPAADAPAGAVGCTVLHHREHVGPLLVQKALYPEGPEVCHVALLHPPAGMVGGDSLNVRAELLAGARALLLTPSATQWYRSSAAPARQRFTFSVGAGASLEWLPRENIFFDGSRSGISLQVDLAADARFLGWEVLCFGRQSRGERWRSGSLSLDTRITRAGVPLWSERAAVDAADGFAGSPVGLAGYEVSATLLVACGAVDETVLMRCRGIAAGEDARTALTCLPGLLVARYLGRRSEQASSWLAALWTVLRPPLLGLKPQAPRLWSC
jgi:urease accessory protein